jgi:CubicO group peptidase (beta-lactamase class C family)
VDLDAVAAGVERVASETSFSGVVRVDRAGVCGFARAYGLANRATGSANTIDGQFAIASGTKGLTALTIFSLVEAGVLELADRARSLLGADLPLIADDVTIEHLLAHRSGIGDYLDEEAGYDVNDHVLGVPVHELSTTEEYVAVLGGYPTKFAAGARFSYSNGGYVVLALLAERATGVPFAELVSQRVCAPAGMHDTAFLRTDELPARCALGYLGSDGLRTNVFHLPVRGSGDGGIYSTVSDIHAMWTALFAGRIVPPARVAEMVRPVSVVPADSMRYGHGFWLHASTDLVMLLGCDAGVSFRSVHTPDARFTHTVISNTAAGAWPVTALLDELVDS